MKQIQVTFLKGNNDLCYTVVLQKLNKLNCSQKSIEQHTIVTHNYRQDEIHTCAVYKEKRVRLLIDQEVIHVPFDQPIVLEYESTSSDNCRYNGFEYQHDWFDYNPTVGAFQKVAFLYKPYKKMKNGTLKLKTRIL